MKRLAGSGSSEFRGASGKCPDSYKSTELEAENSKF